MGTTPTLDIPFPELGDSPHGPNQFEAMALALEDRIGAGLFVASRDLTDPETLATGVASEIPFRDEAVDSNGWFDGSVDTSGSGRFTPLRSGWYGFWCEFTVASGADVAYYGQASVDSTNGSSHRLAKDQRAAGWADTFLVLTGFTVAYADGVDDSFFITGLQNSGTTRQLNGRWGGFLIKGT